MRPFAVFLCVYLFACGDDDVGCPAGFELVGGVCVVAPEMGTDAGADATDGASMDASMDADSEDAPMDGPEDAAVDEGTDATSDTEVDGPEERCSGADDDGDGRTDEGFPETTFFLDEDGDDFGGDTTCERCDISLCGEGDWVEVGEDCNDECRSCFPGGTEICDGLNNDCDASTDEGVTTTYFADQDMDTFGDSMMTMEACSQPDGFVAQGGDCADMEVGANPGVSAFSFFTNPMSNPPESGLAYDYDCDGMETPQFTVQGLNCGTCTSREVLSEPASCGDTVTTRLCSEPIAGRCTELSRTRIVGCR
ncbi:MAG: putative metal-binding motif-containing protein [Myxococcota bacterium]